MCDRMKPVARATVTDDMGVEIQFFSAHTIKPGDQFDLYLASTGEVAKSKEGVVVMVPPGLSAAEKRIFMLGVAEGAQVQEELQHWVAEGEELFEKCSGFARLFFNLGLWWADRPWRK